MKSKLARENYEESIKKINHIRAKSEVNKI